MISVIIPTYHEEGIIRKTVEHTLSSASGPIEVIVSDASGDNQTKESRGPARYIRSKKGRGTQMNTGASIARGDILIFLHADTKLPFGWDEMVRSAVDSGIHAGGFRKRFDPSTPLLLLASIMSNIRASLLGIFFGDTCIFVRKDVFDALGGYADISLMEDIEFSKKLRSHKKKTQLLKPYVYTSSRRFISFGVIRALYLMHRLRVEYSRGVDPELLSRRYAKGK